MEKLQLYRAAVDAVNFLVDFITKENFYSASLHAELFHLSENLTSKISDTILEHVTPKVDFGNVNVDPDRE